MTAITHFVESMDRGGLERVVLELAYQQQVDGNRVQIVCLFDGGVLAKEAQQKGLAVHECHKTGSLDREALKSACNFIKNAATEVLHTHNAMAHYYGVAASIGLGIPIIINTRHGMGSAKPWDLQEILFRLASLVTDFQVAVSIAGVQEYVRKRIFIKRKACVVPNGLMLDTVVPKSGEAALRLRNMLGVSGERLLIGTVGRLTWAKDQIGLIRAFSELNESGNSPHLVIVGGGELLRELKDEAERLKCDDNVTFMGDRQDVPKILAGLDIFVLSSKTEGYSIALLEAMATGLPCVVTNAGGNAEIAENGVSGLVVPVGDPQALISGIEKLMGSQELRRQIGEMACHTILNRNTVRAMADAYYRLYFRAEENGAIDG